MADSFIYEHRKYSVCEVENDSALLDMDEFGLDTTMIHTACYRGYIATLSIDEKALELTALEARVSNTDIPKISGILPKVDELPYDYKKVIRLRFENGALVHAADISVLIASTCAGIKKLEKQGMYIRDYDIINYWFYAETKEEYEAGFPELYGKKDTENLL
jgi:hypothetical protein